MLIGEVARRSGVSSRMLRHYDSLGLVRPSGRTAGGYREYRLEDVERIFHVESLRSLGLSLGEVQQALADPSFRPAELVSELIEQARHRAAREEELLARLRHIAAAGPADWPEVLRIVSLLRGLASPDARQRQRVALSTTGRSTASARSLAEAVLREGETNVAGALRWALARSGDDALAALASGLDSAEAAVRRRAVEAIADLPQSEATELLRTALADPDEVVRARAALALGSRRQPEAVPALVELVVAGVKDVEAAEALGSLAATASVAESIAGALVERAAGATPQVRRRIVQALAEVPGSDELIARFTGDEDRAVSLTARAVLQSRRA